MTAHRFRLGLHLAVASAFTLSLSTLTPSRASAQRGGMGGGGMGGRGGGMGGRGGGMGGGNTKSPAAITRERIEKADPIGFLLDRKKPLELSKEQQDSLKSLHKELKRLQEPLLKDVDKLFGDLPQRSGGGAPRGGGMGGGRGGQARGGGTTGDEQPDAGAAGRGVPDTVRVVVDKISDIQDSFRDRAREQLNPIQRTRVDSLQAVMLAEERAKFEKEQEKRRDRR